MQSILTKILENDIINKDNCFTKNFQKKSQNGFYSNLKYIELHNIDNNRTVDMFENKEVSL